MKFIYLTALAMSFISMAAIPANAAGGTQTNNQNAGNGKGRLTPKKDSGRPGAPSRVFVECEDSAGVLYFVLPADVEYADIYIESAGAVVFSGDITADECALLVPGLAGEYTITCITDDGREFVGDITLN